MILDSLTLTNIRSHRNTTIEFPRGITIFSGHIGSGKSTILMGIEFALFGLGSFKGESLLSKGADSGEVMLAFFVGDTRYEVGRTIKRNSKAVTLDSKGSYLRVNDVLEPLTTKQLKGRILDILGLNEPSSSNSKSRIYRYAVFTPQDEMKSILWDSNKRFETIRKIFHIEEYQTAANNADFLRKEMKFEAAKLQSGSERLDGLRSELADVTQSMSAIADEISAKSQVERELAEQEQSARDEVSRYEARMAEKGALDAQHAGARSKLEGEEHMQAECQRRMQENRTRAESIRSESDSIAGTPRPTERTVQQVSGEIARFEALNEKMIKTRADIGSITQRIDALGSRLQGRVDAAAISAEADRCESELGSSMEALAEMGRTHEATGAARASASTEADMLNESVAALQKLGAKCSLCGHELTKEHMAQQGEERRVALAAARSKILALDEKYAAESEQLRTAEADADRLRRAADSLRKMIPDAEEHAAQSSELERLRADLKSDDAKNVVSPEPGFPAAESAQAPVTYLTALKDALVAYENAQRRAADIAGELGRLDAAHAGDREEMARSLERKRGLESEIGRISALLESYGGDDAAASDAKARLEAVSESRARVREHISAKQAALDHAEQDISRLESHIAEAERLERRYKRYVAYMNWLSDFFIPSVYRIEKDVMLTLQRTFNESYREWYAKLIDDPTKDSYIDEAFAPIVEQDGYEQSVEYLSGGEKTSIALSYRLALNLTVRNTTESLESNLLILDEPTDGLSRDQLVHVKDLLKGLDSKQIILVSHDAEMASHADHVFSVEKASGVTTVRREPDMASVPPKTAS